MVRKSPLPILILAVVFLFVNLSTHAQEMRVAMVDFAVHSRNPDYEFLGKGISEMIAVELAKSPDLTLVEREKRVELMNEMKFALSGLAEDRQKQIEVGNMLAADYLVFGEIVDMKPQLLISMRMTDVESGEVVFREKLTERPGAYEYISGYFASAILDHFDVKVAKSTEKKTEEKREKKEEAVVAFSRAIEAYDRNEEEEAKKELVQAKKFDPDYEAAQVYLQKLVSNTAKFKMVPEAYYAMQNPAYLGVVNRDRLFCSIASDGPGNLLYPKDADDDRHWRDLGDGWNTHEEENRARIGYRMPLGSRSGLSLEAFMSSHRNNFKRTWEDGYTTTVRTFCGGAVGFGHRFGPLSAGISASLFNEWGGAYREEFETISYSLTGGAAYIGEEGDFSVDTLFGWSSATFSFVDPITDEISMKVPTSLYNENTFTLSLPSGGTFLITKQMNDIYIDRGEYFLRLLPVVEHYLRDRWSVRGGVEGSLMRLGDTKTLGYGLVGGTSLIFSRWDLELDISLSYRKRPSRVIEGKQYSTIPMTIILSKTGLFFDRE
jgi:TolB-like protein